MNPGTVGVLNVGAGDIKLSFDKDNPVERIRAARIVKEMIRRGYALLIETKVRGKTVYTRALDFNEQTCEYIIADLAPEAENETQEAPRDTVTTSRESSRRKGGKKRTVAVPAEKTTKAHAVARSAGG